MNELQAIVAAANDARRDGKPALLATVVRVKGSAYRRPGARMLLTADGWQAGSISGGCLEGDILRKAWWRTREGEPTVVTYDSTISEDDDFGEALNYGFGLGCNGVVEVLLERLIPGDPTCPVAFIENCLTIGRAGVLATVIAVDENVRGIAVGQRLCYNSAASRAPVGTIADNDLRSQVRNEARHALAAAASRVAAFHSLDGDRVDVFLEVVQPPIPLVICGAGHDAVPLAAMAKQLGWAVTVVDPRPGIVPRPDRFPTADQLLSCDPRDLASKVALNARTFAIVMTHNVALDADMLDALIDSPVRYIGVLGPRLRTERLITALEADKRAPLRGLDRVHGPVGLDIGADGPESIALSILAEMQSVIATRAGGFLRDRDLPIHGSVSDGNFSRASRRRGEPVECSLPSTDGIRIPA